MTMTATAPVRRYHPTLVILHWVIAALIIITALLGGSAENEGGRPVASSGALHMLLGISVLALLVVRLLMRWGIKRPAWATAGNAVFDLIGRWTHAALYLFTFAVTITGLLLALQTNRLARVFTPAAVPQQVRPGQAPLQITPPPGGFREGGEGFEGGEGSFVRRAGAFLLRGLHGLSWTLLLLLIILHVGAAFYHQFILKDNLLSRMWFGRMT